MWKYDAEHLIPVRVVAVRIRFSEHSYGLQHLVSEVLYALQAQKSSAFLYEQPVQQLSALLSEPGLQPRDVLLYSQPQQEKPWELA